MRIDLRLSDSRIAPLTGVALALFYVTVGVPVALLAHRSNRRNIVAVTLAVWSLLTMPCGLSQTIWQFLLARFGVGIGEAGGTPPSTAMLADWFPARKRAASYNVYALGAPLSAWLGSKVAGSVAGYLGWCAAFRALGIRGFAIAGLLFVTVREPKRGSLDGTTGPDAITPVRSATTLRFLRGQGCPLHMIAGGPLATSGGGALSGGRPPT